MTLEAAAPPERAHPVGDPEVTVVMPVRNERDTIERALRAVLAESGQVSLEVVVVDGMSDDGTRQVVERLSRAHPFLRLVDNPSGGTPQGLNIGLMEARGRYVVRVDGHTIAPPGYIPAMVGHLREGRAEAAGGRQQAVGDGRFGRAVAAVHGSAFGIGSGRHHHASGVEYSDHVTQGAYVTSLCLAVGGFDERFVRNQDCEFDLRFQAAGGRLLVDGSVAYRWHVREAPRALARQYFQYGFWRCRTAFLHPGSVRLRWLAAPSLVAALAVGLALAWSAPGRALLSVVALLYLTALVIGSVSVARRSDPRLVAHVAVAIGIIHLSWGLGFLTSIPGAPRMRRGSPVLGAQRTSYRAAA
jgi:succinoglycan biosynthesis protein ExoA